MNGKRMQYSIIICIICILFMASVNGVTAYAFSGNVPDRIPQNVRAVRHSNTAIRVRWKSDESVDGYIIYRYNRSSRKYKKVKVVKDAAADRWVDRHLKTNTVYRYQVASYKLVDGKKQVSNRSDWVSAKTYKRTTQYINAQAPKVSTQKVYLGLRSTTKIKSKVIASKYGRNRKKKPFSTKVRWYSSDTAVATVDKNGVVTAGIQPGKCSVYAMAHNGAKTRVEVVVKNYAKEDDFYNYGQEDDIYTLITDFKPQIQNIAEYYSINRIGENEIIYIDLDDDANVIITPANADIGNLKEDIEKLLVDFPYYIRIEIYCDRVEYLLEEDDSQEALTGHVAFWFDNDCSQWEDQIADHWEAYRFYPD
ncbi:MAG: Ig-like domain-containing protein [Clostridium sp.]|nr:Ig-like domain-containing protein [Clostridium sp.]